MMTARFLETITALGNDLIIPIDRIKYITTGWEGGETESSFIKIVSDDDGSAFEYYKDEKEFNDRYAQLKSIIGAK